MPGCAARPWSSSFCRLYSTVRRCSSHPLDWMETRVILRWLRPKSVSYRNVSSKADRHYRLLLAHWGSLYYMYTRQHMVHLSDGGGGFCSLYWRQKIRLDDLHESLVPQFTSVSCVCVCVCVVLCEARGQQQLKSFQRRRSFPNIARKCGVTECS